MQKNLKFGIFAPMISAKVCTGFSNGLAYTLRLSLHKKRSFLIVFPVFFAAGRSENGIRMVLPMFAPLGGGRNLRFSMS